MGQIRFFKIIVIVLCLAGTSLALRYKSDPILQHKDYPLKENILPSIKKIGWSYGENIPLDDKIVKALELDDYFYYNFSKNGSNLSVYVGYYLSQKKVGAAHSPLVCFPGQGWELSNKKTQLILSGNDTINTASMIISKGEQRQLIIYWFQAYDRTSPETFRQKINLFLSKLRYGREDNAFIRVTVPLNEYKNEANSLADGIHFIEEFYPIFKNFVIN